MVSPVPLALTMEPTHVARASMYAKSVLKVVGEEAARRHDQVDHLASYELVVMNLGAESVFEPDGRPGSPYGEG